MKICYVDESGLHREAPIATMVGIVLDSSRMHITRGEWQEFLGDLSRIAGRDIQELHTNDFYSGRGRFRDIDGPVRTEIIFRIFEWLGKRKHAVVYASVLKSAYAEASVPTELGNIWRFMGFHLTLAMQQCGMNDKVPKGHTWFVFDNYETEREPFPQLVAKPPEWSDEYYDRTKKQPRLDQISEVPMFQDSKLAVMLQVADFATFFLRRYAEIIDGHSEPRYEEEEAFVNSWIDEFKSRSIGKQFIYRTRKRAQIHDLFIECAPPSVRQL